MRDETKPFTSYFLPNLSLPLPSGYRHPKSCILIPEMQEFGIQHFGLCLALKIRITKFHELSQTEVEFAK
jgi:hypothetical protein